MTRRWKRHSPEQIVLKLRDADAMLHAAKALAERIVGVKIARHALASLAKLMAN
jgi:hypothetical protein